MIYCEIGAPRRCACVKLCARGGIAPSWGSANLAEKVSHDMGCRSGRITKSRDMEPLRLT